MSVNGQAGQDEQQERVRRRGLTPKRIAALWATGLVWIIGVAALEHDLRIGLIGATIELLAVIACINICWFIRHDHDEHTRLYEVGIRERQPIVDVAGALQAGLLLRDEQLRLQDEQEAVATVYDITVRRRAVAAQAKLTMRRPAPPIPPPRPSTPR